MASEIVILTCPVCGIQYGVPQPFYAARHEPRNQEANQGWYCPNGHSLRIRETELDRVRRDRDNARQQIARVEDELRTAQMMRKKAEDAMKRQTRRIAHGVCPCCRRSFANVARHMKSKHPDIVPIAEQKSA